jgi:uncharacterized protein Yka (UPF0111/DUF47 family)
MPANNIKGMSWFSKLFEPRFDFYVLLNAHAYKVLCALEALEQWLQQGAEGRCQIVRDLERDADEIKLDIEKKLNESFVTPFDREDLYDLCAQLDEVANGAKATAREIEAMEIKFHGQHIHEMVTTLVEGTRCIKHAFESLSVHPQEAANQAYLARKSENRFQRTYRAAMHDLYEMDDFKIVMKTREVYRTLITVTERIDRVGEKLLHIIIKIS